MKLARKTADPAIESLLPKAEQNEEVTTIWERYESMQPQCRFGEVGLCCRICMQGPCRINMFGKEPTLGICGARDYTIASRNLLRMIAAGTAAHSDHGRHIAHTLHAVVEGKTKDYTIKGVEKLHQVAKRIGIATDGKSTAQLAKEVADKALEDFSRQTEEPMTWLKTTQTKRRLEMLDRYDVLPHNIDTSVTEIMHRTTLGVDADPVPLIFSGIKCALADMAGEHISTDLSDILFGPPKLVVTQTNLGVLKSEAVNIAVHGHNPVLSEVIVDVAEEMKGEAQAAGATGINIVGICCTGAELLSRRGIPLATNFSSQETVFLTGVVDAMVVDYQCVLPSLGMWAQCYHTKLISTSFLCRQPGDTHIEFRPESAKKDATKIVRLAIEGFKSRGKKVQDIPSTKETIIAGFSTEQVVNMLSKLNKDAPWQVLVDAIKSGKLAGIAATAGCNNVKLTQDQCHVVMAKELLRNNVLVLTTGCSGGALGKAGFISSTATEKYAGEGLKSFLTELGKAMGLQTPLPPVWHMGSCVDNSRIQDFAVALANAWGIDIKDMPVVATAPEDMSEKAVAIGTWLVATGWPVHVGIIPYIEGSPLVMQIAENTAKDVYGGFFIFEKDPDIAVHRLLNILKYRRWKLGISPEEGVVYWNGYTAKEVAEDEEPVEAAKAMGVAN